MESSMLTYYKAYGVKRTQELDVWITVSTKAAQEVQESNR